MDALSHNAKSAMQKELLKFYIMLEIPSQDFLKLLACDKAASFLKANRDFYMRGWHIGKKTQYVNVKSTLWSNARTKDLSHFCQDKIEQLTCRNTCSATILRFRPWLQGATLWRTKQFSHLFFFFFHQAIFTSKMCFEPGTIYVFHLRRDPFKFCCCSLVKLLTFSCFKLFWPCNCLPFAWW